MGTFHSTLHLPSSPSRKTCTALRKNLPRPLEKLRLWGLSICTPQMGSVRFRGGKRETGGEAELWLQWFQEEPKASSSWPHLLQLCPSCPQHSILIAKKDKLKVPEETWPSLTKSSEDKSKDKPRIILRTWNKPGQKGWTLIITSEGSKWLQTELGDTDPVSPSLLLPLHCCPDLRTLAWEVPRSF